MKARGVMLVTLVVALLVTSAVQNVYIVSSNPSQILPVTAPPTLDGNVTTSEWQNSASFNGTLGNFPASVYVTSTNTSNLYFALNFTNPKFIPVNASNPVNQTHDFMALQIDNNLDTANLGTKASPDDVMVIDQYNTSAIDAFTSTNTSKPFTYDVSANGTQNGSGKRLKINSTGQVGYEFTKPLYGSDLKGHDFNINNTGVLQFRFVSWFNQSATANFSTAVTTKWFQVRLNSTGTGFAKAPREANTKVYFENIGGSANPSLVNLFNAYGFNLTVNTVDSIFNKTFDKNALVIVSISKNGYSQNYIDGLINFVKNGGHAMVFLSTDSSSSLSSSQSITSKLNIQLLNNVVLQKNQTSLNLTGFNQKLPFLKGNSTFTNAVPSNVSFDSSFALNLTTVHSGGYVLDQRGMTYPMFTQSNLIYDSNGNKKADDKTVLNDNLTLASTTDLEFGGRISLLPANLISNNFISKDGNFKYLLRMMPWSAGQIYRLNLNSFVMSTHNTSLGTTIRLTANVTNNFFTPLNQAVSVQITVRRAGSPITHVTLLPEQNGSFVGELKMQTFGWFTVDILSSSYGYGFATTKSQAMFISKPLPTYNSLSDLNMVLVVLGLVIPVAVIIYFYTKYNKI